MLIWIKGGGDLASGVALRLHHCHLRVVISELPEPMAVRRTVCFSEAVRLGRCTVEDVTAIRADSPEAIRRIWDEDAIPVLVDPPLSLREEMKPDVFIDATIAKRNTGTSITDAPLVIALGPGFTAGEDCHAVIETLRGHWLGRVITKGSAAPNTGIPGVIGGYGKERVFRAPQDGIFHAERTFGDLVERGEEVASVDGMPIFAEIGGMIRGMLPEGIHVTKGVKAGDIDPRGRKADYTTISDKAMAIAGGVLEAILTFNPCRF